MEIRLEKSLILCASHRLRVRPSYLGEKREGNRQKGERGDKRERGAETDGQQARGGNGVDRWKKVKSGVCRRAASRQKWRWERAGDREMREGKQIYCLWSSYLKGTVHPKIRNTFHLICSRRLGDNRLWRCLPFLECNRTGGKKIYMYFCTWRRPTTLNMSRDLRFLLSDNTVSCVQFSGKKTAPQHELLSPACFTHKQGENHIYTIAWELNFPLRQLLNTAIYFSRISRSMTQSAPGGIVWFLESRAQTESACWLECSFSWMIHTD